MISSRVQTGRYAVFVPRDDEMVVETLWDTSIRTDVLDDLTEMFGPRGYHWVHMSEFDENRFIGWWVCFHTFEDACHFALRADLPVAERMTRDVELRTCHYVAPF